MVIFHKICDNLFPKKCASNFCSSFLKIFHSFCRLWDHLSTSLDLYIQGEETDKDDISGPKLSLDDQAGRNVSANFDSGIESGKSSTLLRSRHNREWKGLVRETADPPPLLSSEIENIHSEKKAHGTSDHGKRSVSPRLQSHRKRSRSDDKHQVKVRYPL